MTDAQFIALLSLPTRRLMLPTQSDIERVRRIEIDDLWSRILKVKRPLHE